MRKFLLSLTLLLSPLATELGAQNLAVSRVGGDGTGFSYYGEESGQRAYSFSTTACNVGSTIIAWFPAGSSNHPVIGQNFFRVADGRIEQLGQSFLKHGFCANNESTCGTCQLTPCATLGLGCADTYGSTLNDGQFGGRKSDIQPTTGEHQDPPTMPTVSSTTLSGRLIVDDAEWGNPGEVYIAEAQYVSEHDHMAGNSRNNASWRQVTVEPGFDVRAVASTVQGNPAIYAWGAFTAGVKTNEVRLADEGGPGVHGYFFVAYLATDLGGGQWRYEYAVQNLTSERAAGSFSIPVPCAVTISDPFFRDVEYHSGEIYDNTDWTFTNAGGTVEWASTTTYAQDPLGNALRWGTLYNFGFTADAPPEDTSARLGIYQPGDVNALFTTVDGPCATTLCEFDRYCNPAVVNSTGSSAIITVGGSLSLADDFLSLAATRMPTNKLGYFISGKGTNVFVPPGSQGNYCLGGSVLHRLLPPALNTGAGGAFSHSPSPAGLPIVVGETWNFQAWFRDQNPGNTSNFTDAVSATFCP